MMYLSLVACVESESSTSINENNSSKKDNKMEFTFDELVVVDNEECLIIINKIDLDNMWGDTLKAVLENKSSDKTYMYSVESCYVNGVNCDPLYASDVAPLKKSNEEIRLSNNLFEMGIDYYTDIELTIRIYDSNYWSADEVARETVMFIHMVKIKILLLFVKLKIVILFWLIIMMYQ